MLKGLIYSLVSAFCLGMLAILIKLAYQTGLKDMALLQYRFLTATLVFGLYLLIRHPRLLRIRPATLAKTAFLGVVLHGWQSTCFFKALNYIPASTNALILYLYPVIVTLLSLAVFRMKADRTIGLSLALLMGGCALVFYDAFLKALNVTGLLFAMGTTLTFSVYLILSQIFLKGEEFLTVTFYVILFTAVPFLFVNNPLDIVHLAPRQLLLALAIGLVPTALGVTFQFLAIRELGSARMSIFSTFEPVATVVMAWLVLGENIVFVQIAGMGLIIAGIVLPNLRGCGLPRERPRHRPPAALDKAVGIR
ncbi:MAG: DMT family transporter [Syntrophales bacterium]|jgi:drug/metabolite transporter (DMT)-like permease|nr:DMT family transporter [Syntrophales bacterium]MDD4338697.1 DMT family transporter [Syntrophales bacterium]HOG08157.1 DMT family transporter [Syntrophales bacterium]HPB69656.1 DMT family transporter [Syntrophales bacterium]HQN26382.1 DMT family transporter [Syntrophales bacterium]